MFMMGFAIGTVLGGMVSFLLVCMVIAGGRADRRMGYWSSERGCQMAKTGLSEMELLETGKNHKQIGFVDIQNQELFWIKDGESIELFSENGDRQTCLCHYLDKRHASIDGKRWELLAFARWMKRQGITYIPSTQQRREGGVVA